MPSHDPLTDLELLIRSRYALIRIDTADEDRLETLLMRLATTMGLPLFTWRASKGLRRAGMDGAIYDTAAPPKALAHVEAARIAAIYHFEELGPYLEDQVIAARLRDAAEQFTKGTGAIVLSGSETRLPESLRDRVTTFEVPAPTAAEYDALLDRVVRDVSARTTIDVAIEPPDRARLLANLRGLTLYDAERILTRALLEDHRLSADDIPRVMRAKQEAVERDGLLEYFAPEHGMGDVVGLDGLKAWLAKRRLILADPVRASQFGLSFPKGILLLGVPGCGKSLCAKSVACEWALPLLRLDPAALYDKYVGETERQFRRATATAERLAPIVLWIDEIEKAFAAGSGEQDGGLSTRILGSFLSWMQERDGDVFVVATANDIERLPPELLRKGRFDEIFFVDLPSGAARRQIFALHLAKRGQPVDLFDLDALAAHSDGFSGAEIEQAIVSALYTAFSARSELTTVALLAELQRTHPLSATMGERLDALRAWAEGKAVFADRP